ncbi:MAG: toll/interleukin-1 receptor domain-containing protein [Planctomycetota bacterium]
MSNEPSFDVFLSHNSKDKSSARELYQILESQYQLRVWYDEEELPPGVPWQPLLEKGIKNSVSAVVAIGSDGLGPWEDQEMQAALTLAASDGRPVIPVVLPTAPSRPELPLFLCNRTWVDFRGGFRPERLDRLVWGITGIKPNQSASNDALSPPRLEPTPALKIWQEKLGYLQEQEATTTDAAQKFSINKQIEECEQKIAHYSVAHR